MSIKEAKIELGKKFRQARESKGLTYYRVAQETGLAIVTLQRLEAGGGSAISCMKLAKYFNIKL